MKQRNHQPRPYLTAVAAADDLETMAWLRVAGALRDYAAAVEALERAGSPAIGRSATPSAAPVDSPGWGGQGRFDLAAAACARARRRVEDALLLLDVVTDRESVPPAYDPLFSTYDPESSAAS